MSHPIDDTVKAYHAKLRELEDVDRQLQSFQPLIDKKASLETHLIALRAKLASETAPPTPSTIQS